MRTEDKTADWGKQQDWHNKVKKTKEEAVNSDEINILTIAIDVNFVKHHVSEVLIRHLVICPTDGMDRLR